MVIGPLVALAGTVVTIWVDALLITSSAVPLKVTALLAAIGSKFVPVMVIVVVPTGPLAGVKVGGASTVKPVIDVARETPSTVTLMGPLVAPAGTAVTIWVGVLLVTTAAVPLKVTRLLIGPTSKFVPVMVTVVPTVAPAGEKPEMVGEGLFPHPERKRSKQANAQPALKSLNICAPPGAIIACTCYAILMIYQMQKYMVPKEFRQFPENCGIQREQIGIE